MIGASLCVEWEWSTKIHWEKKKCVYVCFVYVDSIGIGNKSKCTGERKERKRTFCRLLERVFLSKPNTDDKNKKGPCQQHTAADMRSTLNINRLPDLQSSLHFSSPSTPVRNRSDRCWLRNKFSCGEASRAASPRISQYVSLIGMRGPNVYGHVYLCTLPAFCHFGAPNLHLVSVKLNVGVRGQSSQYGCRYLFFDWSVQTET